MADSESQPPTTLIPVANPLSLIPVGLKEAALDSPTFRATAFHFGEQIDVVERWLESYIKSASRVANEVTALESLINTYLSWATPPQQISEAILDHDYTLLALKRYNEGAKEFWMATIKWMKKVESTVVDPIRAFLQTDVANLKNARRTLEQHQRTFDSLISRYSSQSKTKESSSLREDAFQLHEAKKAYLKASMDYSMLAPQVRTNLDKLLVKIFSDRWRDMKNSRDVLATSFGKWTGDIDRIRGWSKEMENSERIFKRELEMARTQIENAAELAARPSRELDDYAVSTVPYIGSSAPSSKQADEKPYKQGWLFQRTISGKPARTFWVRRWFYVKHGIFGYLTNSFRSGAVEESEKIGVLLCGVRPAFQEERRFCFEVKTKDTTVILQAETQSDLTEWISTFEIAKRKALENPASTEAIAAGSKSVDPAFAVSPPVAPEFAAKTGDGSAEDNYPERASSLGTDSPQLNVRSNTDVPRRSIAGDREGESSRDHAARIISKLKSNQGSPSIGPSSAGGIASLISASHHGLALGAGGVAPQISQVSQLNISTDFKAILGNYLPLSSLAPSTLANPPAPTNLSKTAVVVSGERNLGLGATTNDGGMPGGLMANIWGSANWGFVNRLDRGEVKRPIERRRSVSQPPSPTIMAPTEGSLASGSKDTQDISTGTTLAPLSHRKTYSMAADAGRPNANLLGTLDDYPNYYPLSLKAQDAQFRMLFPDVSRDDKLVLVFRAAWTATDQQEFPGRVYVTMNDMYFYSNHFGLVLISSLSLDSIHEVTAAPGKDCDFLFIHLKPGVAVDGATRVTVKTFLEPLKMLQRRLTFLLHNIDAEEPESLEDVIKTLIKLETGGANESPSMESWEDISVNTPVDGVGRGYDMRTGLRIDGNLYPDLSRSVSRNATKFRLPVQPVVYVPQGMTAPTIRKEFDVTAKALFHVLAGDKSAVFQILNCENGAQRLIQTPWIQPNQGHHRREFRYQVMNGGKWFDVADHQLIDVLNDHLCYVITDRRTPWSLPSPHKFSLMTKIVITHVAKSKCNLSIFTRVDWRKDPLFGKGLIETQALADLKLYATSLTAILVDQVSKLGTQANNSRKAVQIFGQVGLQTQSSHITTTDLPTSSRSGERMTCHSLSSLTFAASERMLMQAGFAVLGLLVQIVQSATKVVTAHSIVVGLLALSAFTNVYYTNRDTWSWWRERNARSFMAKVGVHPNVVMGRSIWLKDLDEWLVDRDRNQTGIGRLENPCASQFNTILSQTDPSASVVAAPVDISSQSPHTQSTIQRLQRSRQHLGSYRHDLLVALRAVSHIEKEMLRAEWESWVWSEATMCKHTGKVLQREDIAEAEDLRHWWGEYCGSCLKEMGRLGYT